MKKFFMFSLAVVLTIMTISCQNNQEPKVFSQLVTADNIPELVDIAAADPHFDQDDIKSLNEILTRFSGLRDSLVGKTVGDLIKKQNNDVRNGNISVLTQTAKKTLMSIQYATKFDGMKPLDDVDKKQSTNALIYTFTNVSSREIKAISGMMQFYNNNNQLVKQYNLTINQPGTIKPGESKQYWERFQHNPQDQRDQFMRAGRNAKIIWVPMMLEFTDGTKYEI